jgi:Ribonucleotide reductase, alpha subunit
LLWGQKSPEGYIKIVSVLQKYIDQGISVNTSYNPMFYPDEKIPLSEMLKHMLMFYKYGGKQMYYFNTFDGQGELDINKLEDLPADNTTDDDDCDSCKI